MLRGLREGERGHVLVLRRAVVPRVREDVYARRFGQPPQKLDVTPEIGRRALDERAAAERPYLRQMRKRGRERGVRIVPRTADA
jgi:hypothetical protein